MLFYFITPWFPRHQHILLLSGRAIFFPGMNVKSPMHFYKNCSLWIYQKHLTCHVFSVASICTASRWQLVGFNITVPRIILFEETSGSVLQIIMRRKNLSNVIAYGGRSFYGHFNCICILLSCDLKEVVVLYGSMQAK